MSQKTGKSRSRRLTTDGDNNLSQFKLPPTKNVNNENENGADKQQVEEATTKETNGDNDVITTTTVETTERVTRSRSNTPQIKQMINGKEENDTQSPIKQQQESPPVVPPPPPPQQQQEIIIIEDTVENTDAKSTDDKDICEMDPLVLFDEPDPELVFDDNSDHDGGSGKASPILNRCVTRRSQTRNIPTPKTPPQQSQKDRIIEEDVDEAEEDEEEVRSPQIPPSSSGGGDLSSTFETCDNLSTKAEIGSSDTTRFNYLNNNEATSEPSSFLLESKDRSYTETLRNLSSRRSLRPVYDYRRRIFNKIDKNVLNSSAPSSQYPFRRDSIERVSVGGNKRRIDDIDDIDNTTILSLKRFKLDTNGIWTKFTSPLTNLKHSFKRADNNNLLQSSTPKLTGYKDERFFVDDDGEGAAPQQTSDLNEKRWCIIM